MIRQTVRAVLAERRTRGCVEPIAGVLATAIGKPLDEQRADHRLERRNQRTLIGRRRAAGIADV